jgi:hypothetical protein
MDENSAQIVLLSVNQYNGEDSSVLARDGMLIGNSLLGKMVSYPLILESSTTLL